VAKRWGFLPTIHMLTPHIKRKKCKKKKKKKLYILPLKTHAAEERKESQCSKKAKRKKRKEEGRNPPSRPATLRRLGLCTGRFGRVLARSVTRPVPIGFGNFQPVISKGNVKTGGYSGSSNRVFFLSGLLGGSGIFS
jgi:hypothetical protein